ncbi:MAG: pyruvate kinase [Pseudomonadota bacterium]|nr:pyruvate kinase [Pseudomonadota bacterium]
MTPPVDSGTSAAAAALPRAPLRRDVLADLLRELLALRRHVITDGARRLAAAGLTTPDATACNLAHYLALRSQDLRGLQQRLAAEGLSSLGRLEGQVLPTLDRVIDLLAWLVLPPAERERHAATLPAAAPPVEPQGLAARAEQLFGPPPAGERRSWIMVTMPSEAADDPALAAGMLAAGMNVARINCAHDDAAAWTRMVGHLRTAAQAQGVSCRVHVDLGGPKLRTGPVPAGPAVRVLRVPRDALGRPRGAAAALLLADEAALAPLPPAERCLPLLPVAAATLARVQVKDRLIFTDASGSPVELRVAGRPAPGVLRLHCDRDVWLCAGAGFVCRRGNGPQAREVGEARLADFPGAEGHLRVFPGQRLRLRPEPIEARPAPAPGARAAATDAGHEALAQFGMEDGEVLADVQPGERVFIDDGRIGARIVAREGDGVILEIEQAREQGEKLKAGKGLNFPDSELTLPALTAQDLADLAFVVAHADSCGLSFARSGADVTALLDALDARGAASMPVIVKVETGQAVRRLPALLYAGMPRHPLGIMVARGDLAVEIGPERMAEIQEEILWLCEAAHVPAVWATQVLETLAKKGRAARGELTDAAMAGRAECVMLNKGPYIERAIRALDDILVRMQAHQQKKFSRLRALHW